MRKEVGEMCVEIEINSPEELDIYIENATLEELYVLREDLINGTASSDEGDD